MDMSIAMPIPAAALNKPTAPKLSGTKNGGGTAFGEILGQTLADIPTTEEKEPVAANSASQSLIASMLAFLQPTTTVLPAANTSDAANNLQPAITVGGATAPQASPSALVKPSDSLVKPSSQPMPHEAKAIELPGTSSQVPTPVSNLSSAVLPGNTEKTPAPFDMPAADPLNVSIQSESKWLTQQITAQSQIVSQAHSAPLQVSQPLVNHHLQSEAVKEIGTPDKNVANQSNKTAEISNVQTPITKVASSQETNAPKDWNSNTSDQPVEIHSSDALLAKPEDTMISPSFQLFPEKQLELRSQGMPRQTEQLQPSPVPDKYEIAAQIVEQAKLITRPQSSEMIIKLKPEHLGELTFKVTVEQGVMSATFLSNNVEVRNIIEASLPQLKQELGSQGIKLDNVGVFAGMDQFLANDQRGNQQYQQSSIPLSRKNAEEFSEAEIEVFNQAKQGTTDGAVDYRV